MPRRLEFGLRSVSFQSRKGKQSTDFKGITGSRTHHLPRLRSSWGNNCQKNSCLNILFLPSTKNPSGLYESPIQYTLHDGPQLGSGPDEGAFPPNIFR